MVGLINLDSLKSIINNRPVLIMLHGNSIERLEHSIEDLKNLDVCYCSINNFSVVEPILFKIGKKLDFFLDCASIPNVQNFNEIRRIPRIRNFLSRRDNNLWISSKQSISTIMFDIGNEEFILRYLPKILLLDEILDISTVPNSSVVLMTIAIFASASKVILCGCDGYKKDVKNISTYYKYDEQLVDKLIAGNSVNIGFEAESKRFQEEASIYINNYCKKRKIKVPKIILCSEDITYTVYPHINYSELKNELIRR